MKMTSFKMKQLLEERLTRPGWTFGFDSKTEQLRIEDEQTGKGISVSVSGVVAKYEQQGDQAVDEIIYHVTEALTAMNQTQQLVGKEKQIYPVIRSTSFPVETKDGKALLFDDHTAETRIYYALDLGNTYRLLDKQFIKKENWDESRIREVARFNVRSLKTNVKEDQVAGNTFYFINTNDGYDASRVLDEALLESIASKVKGTMALAIPHQDVLIIADIQNDTGYDILGQMAMKFFAEGRVPVTALSFLYEKKELEPIFILAKNKKNHD